MTNARRLKSTATVLIGAAAGAALLAAALWLPRPGEGEVIQVGPLKRPAGTALAGASPRLPSEAREGEELTLVAPTSRKSALEESGPATTAAEAEAEEPPLELDDFRAYVSQALEEVRDEKALEMQRSVERKREALESTLQSWKEVLALTSTQEGAIRPALLRQLEREDEHVRLWRGGADESYLSELRQRDRTTFLNEMKAVLDDRQYRLLLVIQN